MKPTWEDIYNKPDKIKCDCEWPNVQRSGSQALGLVIDIDLCCLAKAVEELTGKKFYRVVETEPVFVWDCEQEHIDKEGNTQKLGLPPKFMLERMKKNNIIILNEP